MKQSLKRCDLALARPSQVAAVLERELGEESNQSGSQRHVLEPPAHYKYTAGFSREDYFYLRKNGVSDSSLSKDIKWLDKLCTALDEEVTLAYTQAFAVLMLRPATGRPSLRQGVEELLKAEPQRFPLLHDSWRFSGNEAKPLSY